MKRCYTLATVFSVFLGLLPACRADNSPYQDLLRRLPDSTNVLVVVDVPALRSALDVAPGTSLVAADVSSLPVMAKKFVMGAKIDLSERKHVWSIAMAQLSGKMPIQDIAKTENEQVDQFAGYSVVPTPRGGYFVEVAKDVLGVRSPGDRQELKRWLTYQKSNPVVGLPPYLLQAANPETPAIAIMAISLEDSLEPGAVHRSIMNSQVMSTRKSTEYPSVEKALLSIEGLTFTIRAGNPLKGTLVVDFGSDTGYILNFGKRLLIEALQNTGLYVPDFDSWEPILGYRVIGISGPLSVNGVRKFGALIRTPVPNPDAASMTSLESMSPQERTIATSKRYFKSITSLQNDLKKDKTASTKGLSGWYDKYADQIDKLPTLNVDQELVNFAAGTAQHLRAMSTSLNGISLQSGYLQQQKVQGQTNLGTGFNRYYNPYSGGYYGGGWSDVPYGTRGVSNYGQVYLQQDALVRQGAQSRAELWQMIDDQTADIRRQMTAKYKTEF